MLRFVSTSDGGSGSTGSDEVAIPQTKPHASSADVDKAYEIEELELKDDNGKEKGSDAVDCSDSGTMF